MDRRQRWRLGTGPCRLVLAGLALRLKLKAAADLVHLKVDLIYAATSGATRAARQATTTIPISFSPCDAARMSAFEGRPAAKCETRVARPSCGNWGSLSLFTRHGHAKHAGSDR
jgi:hypothetical protein